MEGFITMVVCTFVGFLIVNLVWYFIEKDKKK